MSRSPIPVLIVAWLGLVTPAGAEPLAVELTSLQAVELSGSPYVAASGFLEGTAPGGVYRVAVDLLVPQGGCNGSAIVDVTNSVLFEFPPVAPLGHQVLPFARIFLGDDLIAGRGDGGFVYLGLQWNQMVTEETGAGVIQRGTDGYRILADALCASSSNGSWAHATAPRPTVPRKNEK